MASLSDILSRRWKGSVWTLIGDDYNTLVWDPSNAVAKPLEADIRALSDAVDLDIAADLKKKRQEAFIEDSPDTLLLALEILSAAIADIQGKLRSQSLSSPLAPAATQAITTMRTKLANARNQN